MPYKLQEQEPEVAVRNFVRDLINNYVLKNTTYTTEQFRVGAVAQNTILTPAEEGKYKNNRSHHSHKCYNKRIRCFIVEEKTPTYPIK